MVNRAGKAGNRQRRGNEPAMDRVQGKREAFAAGFRCDGGNRTQRQVVGHTGDLARAGAVTLILRHRAGHAFRHAMHAMHRAGDRAGIRQRTSHLAAQGVDGRQDEPSRQRQRQQQREKCGGDAHGSSIPPRASTRPVLWCDDRPHLLSHKRSWWASRPVVCVLGWNGPSPHAGSWRLHVAASRIRLRRNPRSSSAS